MSVARPVRTIALDKHTVKALRAHRSRQQQEFERAGLDWCAAGYVFTCRRSQPVHPQHLTRRFSLLVAASGLPPVRLHDLRHGAACLAHAAGADLKTIQQQLGHASIAITADIYTTVLPTTQRQAAKATARLLKHCSPKATRKSRHKRRAQPGRPDA